MNTREEKPGADAARLVLKVRIAESLDRLIVFYTATKKTDEAKKYRELRAKYPLEVTPPPRKVWDVRINPPDLSEDRKAKP